MAGNDDFCELEEPYRIESLTHVLSFPSSEKQNHPGESFSEV